MQNTEFAMPLENRDPLAPQATLELYDDHGNAVTFRIDSLLGAGGTSLVYHVTRLSDTEGDVQGSLKEFYPRSAANGGFNLDSLLRSLTVARRPNGSLQLPRKLCRTRTERLQRVMRVLHDLKRSGDLNYFIPYMQLYQGECGVPYVFTPENLSGITLENYLQQAHRNPDRAHLLQILNTLYAMACADELLCSRGALMLDIKPANVLLVRRSGGTSAGMEKNAYLADAVSLFDVESILLCSELEEEPELPFSQGFTAPELGGNISLPRYYKVGPASDVYALASTLFYALTGCLATGVDDYAGALAEGPFAAELQQADLYGILGRLLNEGLMFEPTERIGSPREFGSRVMEAITRTEMHLIAEMARSEREEAEKLPEMLTHLLFRWPLHEYADGQDMRLLIVGREDPPIRQALDAVVSSCHVLGCQLHIAVAAPEGESILWKWCSGISHAEDWLDCRGSAPFAPYAWEERMAQLCSENITATRADINELVDRWQANGVLLLTENQVEGSALAAAILPPRQGRRLVAYRGCLGKTLYPERVQDNQTVICMTPAACDDSFRDAADRIGFNAHLLYMREKDRRSGLAAIRRDYRKNAYNYAASQEAALAVKCKLWSAGVPWTGETASDAALFAEKLRQDPGLVAGLSWLEHRRWLASKLVKGTCPLPEERYDLLLAGNNNDSVTNIRMTGGDGREHLYHAYLVPSRPDAKRPEGWQTPAQWAARPLTDPVPPELDPLDRACVGLTRMYIRNAARLDLRTSEQALFHILERHRQWLEPHAPAAAQRFALLAESLKQALRPLEIFSTTRPEHIPAYEDACLALQEALEERQGAWGASAWDALKNLDREVRVIVQALRGIDAKRYDTTLVKNMDFLLGGGGLTLGKLLSDGCLLDNLRPAGIFLADRVVCAAYAPNEEAARKYGSIYARLRDCFGLQGMDTPLELRLFLEPGVSAPDNLPGLVSVPVQGSLESTFTETMRDCGLLDVTGGQPALSACAGRLDIHRVCLAETEGGAPRALRGGILPPAMPVRKPLTLAAAFALSGARRQGGGEEQGSDLFRQIFTEYQAIRRELSGPAWHDACEAFRIGYEKFSRWYLRTPDPADPLDTPCEWLLGQEDARTLMPLFRSLEKEGFVRAVEECPYGTLIRVNLKTTAALAGNLWHSMDLIQKKYFVVQGFARDEDGWRNFRIHGRPNQIKPEMPTGDAVRVYQRLAAKGWMQWDDYAMMARYVAPELIRMLLREGSTLESDIYMQIVQSGLFEECRSNYEYRWGDDGPANELDVVAVCGEWPVLISCKACRRLEPDMAYEIYTESDKLKADVLPVLVASELAPGDQPEFRKRCRALGVLLIDASEQADAARRIAAAAGKTL